MAQAFSFPNYGLFNATYYLQQNPDVATSWTGTPLQHYIQFGALEGRAPTAWFNADFYRQAYTDLQSMNALQLFNHYCNFGFNEGRVPMLNFSNFNGARYLLDNPDVAAAGYTTTDAISHYVVYGEYEGRTAYAQNGVVINPVVNLGNTYTLTTGTDNLLGTQFNDTFNAPLAGAAGTSNTLNSLDQLDGAGGTDTLNATINTSVTPAKIANMEIVNATVTGGGTLGLLNAGQLTQLNNVNSSVAATFNNIAASATTLGVSDTNQNTTFNYQTTTGTQTAALNLSNVTGGTETINGIETINITSSNSANTYAIDANAATTLSFAGAADQTVTLGAGSVNVSNFNGSAATGNVNLTLINQTGVSSATAVSVSGGSGNDTLTVTAETQSDTSVNAGAGNDIIVNTAISTADTVDGGTGVDALRTNSAQVAGLTAATAYSKISNVERLEIADSASGVFTLSRVDSGINTLQFNADSLASTVTGAEGKDLTVNIGNGSTDTTTNLGGTLTVTDAATGLADVANIVNNSGNVAANGAFGSQNIVSNGYETVNITTTGFGAATTQVIGTISVTGDTGATTVETVNFSGSNTVSTGAITADFVNASGLTAAIGTVFTSSIANGTTASVTGSAGNDSITSTTGSDTLSGGAGNDTLTAGTGNDSINGGAGNDRIVFGVAGDLTTADTVDGGTGTNTLAVTAADLTTNANLVTASQLAALGRVSNVQTVELIGAVAAGDKVNVNAVSSGINRVDTSTTTDTGSGTFTFNTGASTLNLNVLTTNAQALTAAGTGTADSLTVVKNYATNDDAFNIGTVTGIETLNFNTGSTAIATAQNTGNFTLTATGTNPNATITATGVNAFTLGAVTTGGSGKLTIDGSALTAQAAGTTTMNVSAPVTTGGTVSITGSSGQDVLVGDVNDANTIFGGAGIDTITGGSANDSLDGGDGNDTITTNGGSDTVIAGAGADTVDASAAGGTVSILGGDGNDVINIGATLTSGDIIDGGTGTNTFSQSTALISAFAGVTNFSTLQLDASMTQDVTKFTGTTFTEVDLNGATTFTVSGLANGVAIHGLTGSTITAATHATPSSTDTLTIGGLTAGGSTLTSVTVNDTDTLTINAGHVTAGNILQISSLNAIDVDSIVISGTQKTTVVVAADGATGGFGNTAARTIAVDASGASDTVTFSENAASSQKINYTGSSSASNVVTGATGADTIVGGNASDTIVGGLAGDTINVGAGTDTISYTAASQSGAVTGTIGAALADQVLTGVDVVTGMAAADVWTLLGTATSASSYDAVAALATQKFIAAASTTTLIDNGASLIRGSYNSLTGGWTTSGTGTDTLLVWDQNATAASANYQGVVLVGVTGLTGTSAWDAGSASVVLTLA